MNKVADLAAYPKTEAYPSVHVRWGGGGWVALKRARYVVIVDKNVTMKNVTLPLPHMNINFIR